MKYLITGIGSGLGKYLYENLPNADGLKRGDVIEDKEYDVIIHCAFNKSLTIEDYYQYLEDNIFLTQKLLNLKYKNFIYISTVDVYSSEPNNYGLFKRFAESVVKQNLNTVILRCSMILGKNTKPNHVTKLKDNIESIGLNGSSTFNYILNKDILKFIELYSLSHSNDVIDFVPNKPIKLFSVREELKSTTELGDYLYTSDHQFSNPIYNLYEEFNKSSLDNLKQYINE